MGEWEYDDILGLYEFMFAWDSKEECKEVEGVVEDSVMEKIREGSPCKFDWLNGSMVCGESTSYGEVEDYTHSTQSFRRVRMNRKHMFNEVNMPWVINFL